MAWTIDTFDDTICTGVPSGWRVGMYELIRAVHEREIAVGLGSGFGGDVTSFKIAGGSFTPVPTLEQLRGMRMNIAEDNLIIIQDAIVALLSGTGTFGNVYFWEDPSFSDAWTVASMEAAIGTSLSEAPLHVREARFWQAQKDALDRMIYIDREAGTAGFNSQLRQGFGVTLQDAWDDTIAETPVPSFNGPAFEKFGGSATIVDDVTAYFNDTDFPGVLVASKYKVFWHEANGFDFSGTFELDVNGTVFSRSDFSVGAIDELDADIADTPMDADFSVPIVSTIPTIVPFGTAHTFCSVSAPSFGVHFLIDITGELTDQD